MRRVLLAALAWLMLAAPVAAQWQVPNNHVPFGRGSGTGFKSDAGFTFTPGGPLAIAPTANTLTKGLNIVNSGPVTASDTGPQSYNLVTVTEAGETTLTGAGRDAYNLFNGLSSAFRVNHEVAGILPAIRIAGTFASNYTGSSATMETVGLIGSTYSNATWGAGWGVIGFASAGPASTVAALIGVASEIDAQAGSSVLRRVGFLALTEAPVQGSEIDAAIVVAAQGGSGHGTPGVWKNVISISNSWLGATTLDASSNFFNAVDAMTIGNWAQMPNVTVVGNIMLFPNLYIPGAAAGFTLPAHSSGAFQYGGTNSNGVQMEVNAFTGPALFYGTRANTSSTAPSAMGANETTVAFAGLSYNSAGGYFNNAAIGMRTAEAQTGTARGSYMTFFTTPLGSVTLTEAMRIGSTGALLVGTTTDAAAGVVNVATGFRIANAATSGNVLRGNGTNFVSSALATTDLSGLGTNVATALAINVGSAGAFVVNGGALGTPSSGVGTNITNVNAATLGGATFAAPGAIGGGTPSTGAFTTLSASTSITSPLHYGGSAAGSTLAINGTSSGSPSSAFLKLQSNGQFVGIGSAGNPTSLLDVNANTTTDGAPILATSVIHVQSADGANGGQEWTTFGGSGGNILSGGVASGTAASPTATAVGQFAYNMRGYGYNSGWQLGALWTMIASQTWSAGNQGMRHDWYTTPNGSTTITKMMTLHASGGLQLNAGGADADPGIGVMSAANGFRSGASAGLSATKTVRASGGAADCTLIYTGGILTGGTC